MTFRGTLTRGHDPKPRAVTITLEAATLCAVSDEGETITIALDSMTYEPGGFDGDFVFCRPRDASFTIATTADGFVSALRVAGGASLEPSLAKIGQHRVASARSARLSKIAALSTVALILLALWNVPNLLAASVGFLPTEVDRQLGDAAAENLTDGATVGDPTASAFLDEIRTRLTPHAHAEGHEIRISIERNEIVNAFALPGGRVVVFTGLLCAAQSGEEVAGVLAHELAHVTERHGLRNVAHRAGIGLAVSLLFGDVEGWTALAADVAALASQSQYSQAQESAADAEGVRIMAAASLDASALASFFRTMQAKENADGTTDASLSWLSSHPDHGERIREIEARTSGLGEARRVPLQNDLAVVQRSVCSPQ